MSGGGSEPDGSGGTVGAGVVVVVDGDEVVDVDVGAPVVAGGRSATIVVVVVVPARATVVDVARVVPGTVVVRATVVDVDGPPVVLVA
jgi:hypothetical protein